MGVQEEDEGNMGLRVEDVMEETQRQSGKMVLLLLLGGWRQKAEA